MNKKKSNFLNLSQKEHIALGQKRLIEMGKMEMVEHSKVLMSDKFNSQEGYNSLLKLLNTEKFSPIKNLFDVLVLFLSNGKHKLTNEVAKEIETDVKVFLARLMKLDVTKLSKECYEKAKEYFDSFIHPELAEENMKTFGDIPFHIFKYVDGGFTILKMMY